MSSDFEEAQARAERIRVGYELLPAAEAEAVFAWALSLDIDNEAREVLSDEQ